MHPLDVPFHRQTSNVKTLQVLTEEVFVSLCNDGTPADAFCVERKRVHLDGPTSEICRIEIKFLPLAGLGLRRFGPLAFQAKSWLTPAASSSKREMLYPQPVEKTNQDEILTLQVTSFSSRIIFLFLIV